MELGILHFVDEAVKYAKLNNNIKLRELYNKLDIKHYIPYSQKVQMSQNIIYKTCLDSNGNIVYNSPQRYINYVMSIVISHTNLICIEDNITIEYDALKESGILKDILENIGEEELTEFRTVWNMVYDDMMLKNNSIPSLIGKAIDRFSFICNGVMEKLSNAVENIKPETLNKILNNIQKFVSNK